MGIKNTNLSAEDVKYYEALAGWLNDEVNNIHRHIYTDRVFSEEEKAMYKIIYDAIMG